jgi:hypothetical protein
MPPESCLDRLDFVSAVRQAQLWAMNAPLNVVDVKSYFHSQILVCVFPSGSSSYSKTPTALFKRANFWEVVR